MSDIRVQFDNRTERVNSVLISPRENNWSLQSNGRVRSSGENDMESEDTSTGGEARARCTRWSTCSVISIGAIAVLGGFIVGVGITYARTSKTSNHGGTPHSGLASSQTGNIEINNGGLDLRIDLDTSGCDGPTCTRCRTQVSSSHHMPIDPLNCTVKNQDPNIINSSCYLCNGECKTLSDLLHVYQNGGHIMCTFPELTEIDCCLITQMGNLGNVCGEGGRYECYGEGIKRPICKCPHGKTGDRCQDSNTEMLNCRCYTPAYKFCGQEDMVECNNVNRGPNVTQCHMDVDRRGERHNCACSTTDEGDSDDSDLGSCVIPHTDAQTNGSVQHFQDFLLHIVLLIIILVDKT